MGRNTTAKARWREGRREGVSQEFLRVLPSRVCAFAVVFLLGCVPKGGAERPHIKYTGPTLTLEELVRQINAQNGRIKTLWASGEFDCTVLDEKKNEQRIDGDNLLINYRKPGELRLVGQKMSVRLFDVGCNREQFWLFIPYEKIDTMWWGEMRNADRVDPNAMPIRPDLLVEVLGVNALEPELLKSPIPAMRFTSCEANRGESIKTFPLSERLIK